MKNDWQDRLRLPKSNQQAEDKDDITAVWAEQKRMQSEDMAIQEQIKRAKKQAKELQKKLRKNRYGEFRKGAGVKKSQISSLTKRHREVVLNLINSNKKISAYFGTAMVLIILVSAFFILSNNSGDKGVLGDNSSTEGVSGQLPKEKPEFRLLYPQGVAEDQFEVVRISPPGTEPSYTYLDRFTEDGAIFRVTQQQIPSGFSLEKTAQDFQATNVIKINDTIIYHGYSEKGGIQSLLFEKDRKLILIRSTQKFPDDVWVGYFLSLR